MNQAQLQEIARQRLIDAAALIEAGRWAAAYYLVGYAIECGLKSCILKHITTTGIIFRDQKYLKDLPGCWSHSFDKLLEFASLTSTFGTDRSTNSDLQARWGVVKDWKETSRYEEHSEQEAKAIYEATTNEPNGVLSWIKNHW